MNSTRIVSEHLLLGLVFCAKGICLKIFQSYGVEYEILLKKILSVKNFDKYDKDEKDHQPH